MLAPAAYDGLIRGLDPCAGKGAALDEVAWGLRSKRSETGASANVMSYAVEPAPARYDALPRASSAGTRPSTPAGKKPPSPTRPSRSSTSTHPTTGKPSEREEEDGNEAPSSRQNRLEYNFLRETMHKLQPGGLLIFVAPAQDPRHRARRPHHRQQLLRHPRLFAARRRIRGLRAVRPVRLPP